MHLALPGHRPDGMYLSHYNLDQPPFHISPDPKFLWLGEKHREALAVLKYGVMNNQGFLLLTGDVGTGKTTLINALVNSLGSDTFFINVTDPRLDKMDFFKLVAHSFGLKTRLTSKLDFFVPFKHFLHRAYESKKKVLLIIDEAQKLSLDSLEEIRLLSNIERQDSKLLNVFFIGQNEFSDTLLQPECRALRQRITIVHNIEPLNDKETSEYVKYRLSIAGTQEEIFTEKAIKKVHAFSKGYPRLINIICDRALLTGYSRGLGRIAPKIIRECAKELTLPRETRQRPPSKTAQETRPGRSPAVRAAVVAGLVFVLALSGYVIASRLLPDHRFSLKRYYGSLFGRAAPDQPERISGRTEVKETVRLPASSPLPPRSTGESDTRAVPGSHNPEEMTPGLENAPGHEASEQNNLFRGGRLIVPFGYNANELPPEIAPRLDELATYMVRQPHIEIVIRGYTDPLGGAEYNRNLSTFRANVVKSYLVGKGISANRMRVIGMGDASPRMPNTSAEGRGANRRVEIEVVARKF